MNENTIFFAVQQGDLPTIQRLATDKTTLEAKDQDGRTPLMNAVIDHKEEVLNLLISLGADCRACDKTGFTALHFAAQNYAESIATILLENGAVIDAQDNQGNTSLHKAVFNSQGRGNMIKLLRKFGADPHRLNKHGTSPLSLSHTIANYSTTEFFS